MTLQAAIAADREGRIEDAAALYEAVLTAPDAPLQAFMNLAVLYWQATDYGFSTAVKLKSEFVRMAGRRRREVLQGALLAYPGSTEALFWTKYMAWADLGGTLTLDECEDLLSKDPSVLVPAMHEFALSNGSRAQKEAEALLSSSRLEGTVRAKYICSVVEAALQRARRG
jgi:hypothetical protein